MKKETVNKKSSILPIILLAILILQIVIISAADATNVQTQAQTVVQNVQQSFDFFKSSFYTNLIRPYFVSQDIVDTIGSETGALIIGLIALLIVFAIMTDIILLVSPFSETVNWIMGIGLGIVMIIMKLNIWFASWVVLVGAVAFGWAGTLSLLLTIILAICALWFIFRGGMGLQKWLISVRARRRGLELTKTAMNSAADIGALRRLARQALRRNP